VIASKELSLMGLLCGTHHVQSSKLLRRFLIQNSLITSLYIPKDYLPRQAELSHQEIPGSNPGQVSLPCFLRPVGPTVRRLTTELAHTFCFLSYTILNASFRKVEGQRCSFCTWQVVHHPRFPFGSNIMPTANNTPLHRRRRIMAEALAASPLPTATPSALAALVRCHEIFLLVLGQELVTEDRTNVTPAKVRQALRNLGMDDLGQQAASECVAVDDPSAQKRCIKKRKRDFTNEQILEQEKLLEASKKKMNDH
jgi:hypothetical protein